MSFSHVFNPVKMDIHREYYRYNIRAIFKTKHTVRSSLMKTRLFLRDPTE
jgi:hypothetical protein